jgi:hypothetical protein
VGETAAEVREHRDVAEPERLGVLRHRRQLEPDQEDRADEVRRRVDDERAADADPLDDPAAHERAGAERDAPRRGGQRVGVVELVLPDRVGQRGRARGVEEDPDRHLQPDEHVEPGQVLRLADEQEREHDPESEEVRDDHQHPARQPVGDRAGERAEERGRKEAQRELDREEDADAEDVGRGAEAADQDETGDAVEPVARLADELGEPEPRELRVPDDAQHPRHGSRSLTARPWASSTRRRTVRGRSRAVPG